MAIPRYNGSHHIDGKEGIAHVVKGGDAEHDVVKRTDSGQSETIEQGLTARQLPTDVVDSGQGHDDQCPHGQQEEAQMERHAEGVERGMIVEMTPRLRGKQLDGAVKDGRRGYEQAEQCGIERGDVVEMDDAYTHFQEAANHEERTHQHDDGQEKEQMDIGEEVDELRDGGVGQCAGQQIALMNPANGLLVAGHLHPDGVERVGGHGGDVGHNQAVALADGERIDPETVDILGGMLGYEAQGVGLDQEVEVLRVVVAGIERNGVDLTVGQVPRIRGVLGLIVAGGKEGGKQQEFKNAQHRHSFGIDDSRTPSGTAARRTTAGRGVHGKAGAHRSSYSSPGHGASSSGTA